MSTVNLHSEEDIDSAIRSLRETIIGESIVNGYPMEVKIVAKSYNKTLENEMLSLLESGTGNC